MKVRELSRKQLEELKCGYYLAHTNHEGTEAFSDPKEIPDEVIFDCYDTFDFDNDNFVCSSDGRGELDSLLNPHFTAEEIEKIIEFAKKGYENTYEEHAEKHMRLICAFIPSFILSVVNTADKFNKAFENVIGRRLTEKEWKCLYKDVDDRFAVRIKRILQYCGIWQWTPS